jgi:antitoxin (DNA-binding transcriptional repressor) of toxin-antitoxin stability system
MRAVGIKVLKNRLSEYVRAAADGETILVTDRDRVVAELGPPHAGRSAIASDAVLADLVRRGWLSPPTGDLPGHVGGARRAAR